MAILSKIRQRSFFLIVVIALALFSFVLADLIKGGSFGAGSRYAGTVNGANIMGQEFQYKVGQAEQRGMSNVQASNGVWDQEVKKIILGTEFDELGLSVGKDQLINLMKQNPNLASNPQFQNAAGTFDEGKFKEFVKTMLSSQNVEQKNQWKTFEVDVENEYKEILYYTMIKSGMQSTQIEGQVSYEDENNKVDFDFVTVAYSTVNDDEAKISDDEIMAYMKENNKKFKSVKMADLDLVFIENKPSKSDEDDMKSSIEGLLNGGKVIYNKETGLNETIVSFKNATNTTEYINTYSDIKFDSTFVAKKDLPLDYQEQLFALANGEVFGPYVDNGYQKLSKKIASKSGSAVKASHILIAFEGAQSANPSIKRTKEEAKLKANQLLVQAKANPSIFGILASANTDDPGSKQTGGEYDNIVRDQMVKPFNDFIFNNSIGSIGVVETDFGFHVIKVTDKYNSVLLATVAQKVEPSETTSDQNYTKASKFEAEANSKDFAEVAKQMELEVKPVSNIKNTDENILSFGSQRGIVLWALSSDTNKGDVKRFDVPTGFVVVQLKSLNDSGLSTVENARAQVEPILKNKKKALIIRKKMTGKTVQEVSKVTNAAVVSATGVTMKSALMPNIGPEFKVVGKAFGQKASETSGLIDGTYGVYMVKTKVFEKANTLPNYTSYINQSNTQAKNSTNYKVLEALKAKSDIEDLRIK
ncbi:peptidylprolyl isomerase [uncultured Flavobacterium sp.]|uniref:peptidylprolyl isomerase n=1 Tax=uncultured Flavobacterium sp. TaxID=165435 RepID=UPI0030CA244A